MKKWVLSAIAYLLVVVGAYYAYTAIEGPPDQNSDQGGTEEHNN
jgi:hypothetical protein